MVKRLGADVVVDYKRATISRKILSGYDVALNSLDGKTLEKSLNVLKPGGQLISISGPPDPQFAKEAGLSGVLKLLMGLLSRGIRNRAKARHASYAFVFMRASGQQLAQITKLIEAGAIKPVVDRILPFKSLNEAMAYVESGRAKGKVVIKVK
ncbi:zinc-binding dehydrogenase [Caulobacter segnis]